MAVAVAAVLAWSAVVANAGETSMVATKEGVPGGVRVDAVKVTATVTDLDAAKRLITIKRSDGVKRTFKAGPEVVNFGQIKVGDQVSATVAESLVVFLKKDGEPSGANAAAAVGVAPEGEKPGMVVAGTVEVTAKIKALDPEKRTATLELPGGEETVPVRQDVDMSKAKVGDSVVIRMTEAVAIQVEKP
jgi:hypothetical protein